jgi:hypothetical protein
VFNSPLMNSHPDEEMMRLETYWGLLGSRMIEVFRHVRIHMKKKRGTTTCDNGHVVQCRGRMTLKPRGLSFRYPTPTSCHTVAFQSSSTTRLARYARLRLLLLTLGNDSYSIHLPSQLRPPRFHASSSNAPTKVTLPSHQDPFGID